MKKQILKSCSALLLVLVMCFQTAAQIHAASVKPAYRDMDAASKQTKATSAGFSDVPSDAYYYDAVTWAVECGITSGTSVTTFSPNQNCTVAQILTFLWRTNGGPRPSGSNPFSDVKSTDYYASASIWAYEKGIVPGGTFGGNTPCTRSMAVTYMWKAAGGPSTKTTNFTDVPAGADYAKAVAWAVEKGITSGTSATTFSPNQICTRAQIVTFLWRFQAVAENLPDLQGMMDALESGGYQAILDGILDGTLNIGSQTSDSFGDNGSPFHITQTTSSGQIVITNPANPATLGHEEELMPPASDNNIANFSPVPMKDLANRKSLQKKATDEQLAQAYAEAVKLVTPYAGLSMEQQLTGIAQSLRQRFDSGMSYSMTSSHYNDPYGYFIEGSASCAGCTRATGLCLNILGIPYEHVNENQYSHQWCRVNVNGTYWICDAYGLYCGPEPSPYTHPYF